MDTKPVQLALNLELGYLWISRRLEPAFAVRASPKWLGERWHLRKDSSFFWGPAKVPPGIH
jgi:hypothetical protein